MLFSTSVNLHIGLRQGTASGMNIKQETAMSGMLLILPQKTKRLLFDQDKLAAELTEIVKDPYTAQQLPIQKLETGEDGRTFTSKLPLHKTPKGQHG